MKKFYTITSVFIMLIFTIGCSKTSINEGDINSEMRTRPPCYEIAIDTAIKNYIELENILKELLPLSEDAKQKGCFEEFKIIITEMYVENYGIITEHQQHIIQTYFE